jgi:hypothetical protein
MRKILIALAALAAIAVMIPLDAYARHGDRGGGWHGGGSRGASIGRGFSGARSFRGASIGRAWRGGGWRGARIGRAWHGGGWRGARIGRAWHGRHSAHRFRGGRFFVAAAPLLYAPYDFYDDYYYDGCYQLEPVLTPRGLRWRSVWACY